MHLPNQITNSIQTFQSSEDTLQSLQFTPWARAEVPPEVQGGLVGNCKMM